MAKPEWGKKHLCTNCPARYYDMGANAPVCPKCGAEAVVEQAPTPQRSRKAKTNAANGPSPAATPTPKKGRNGATKNLDAEIDAFALDNPEDDDKDLLGTEDELDAESDAVAGVIATPFRREEA